MKHACIQGVHFNERILVFIGGIPTGNHGYHVLEGKPPLVGPM